MPPYPTLSWFQAKGFVAQPFQIATQQAYLNGKSGLLNAPTGSGKTMALFLGFLTAYIEKHPTDYQKPRKNGLQVIWLTPLRALAKDLQQAMQSACDTLQVAWTVALRTGDTAAHEKQRQQRQMPECILTTPESLHVLLAQKDCSNLFDNLQVIVLDEWHELLGSKRGVQAELALSRLVGFCKQRHQENFANYPKIWGISATIGNMDEAAQVLRSLLPISLQADFEVIRANQRKTFTLKAILPPTLANFSYTGQLGTKLIPQLLPLLEQATNSLIFLNTRSQTDVWYQKILEAAPEWAGQLAIHHSSIDKELRLWVENALQAGKLKAVVCTSSLDLGVDFPSVDRVVQIGSPKGVSRLLQRGGRSGHRPDAPSEVYFLPTHSLELVECAALRVALAEQEVESRKPLQLCIDVLVQYLITLAVGEGFDEQTTYQEVKTTYCFQHLTAAHWQWLLQFITTGGSSLAQYPEYKKVEIDPNSGLYKVLQPKMIRQHRLSIGTIVSEPLVKVQYQKGTYLGMVEESFASSLSAGDTFFFAGAALEVIQLKDFTLFVQKSKRKTAQIPRWLGGRLPLSSQLAAQIRKQIHDFQVVTSNLETSKPTLQPEMEVLRPLLAVQQQTSALPLCDQLLIENIKTSEGYHWFVYPFAGRTLHEILAVLFAYRIAQQQPITFSMAFNEYGFELLADQSIDLVALLPRCLALENIRHDIAQSLNQTEMAKRRFREIATIGGLIFQGFPHQNIRSRHLQASAGLLFEVLSKYEPDHLLLAQAHSEVMEGQLGYAEVEKTLLALQKTRLLCTTPTQVTPFAFPILIDRLREQLSSETLEQRIEKMQRGLQGCFFT